MDVRLEKILDDVNLIESQVYDEKCQFYNEIIPVHNDEKLRSFVRKYCNCKPGLLLIEKNKDSDFSLYYGMNGFKAGISFCRDPFAWIKGMDGYDTRYYNFKIIDDKLITSVDEGPKEMLNLFPKLTMENVYTKLESEMKKIDIYEREIK
jgi:hypothetical protein